MSTNKTKKAGQRGRGIIKETKYIVFNVQTQFNQETKSRVEKIQSGMSKIASAMRNKYECKFDEFGTKDEVAEGKKKSWIEFYQISKDTDEKFLPGFDPAYNSTTNTTMNKNPLFVKGVTTGESIGDSADESASKGQGSIGESASEGQGSTGESASEGQGNTGESASEGQGSTGESIGDSADESASKGQGSIGESASKGQGSIGESGNQPVSTGDVKDPGSNTTGSQNIQAPPSNTSSFFDSISSCTIS